VAAVATQAVVPSRVLAGGDHQPLIQGEDNNGTITTVVIAPGASGLEGRSDVGDGLRGISKGAGKSGVYGYNSNADGYGVFGRNESGGTATTGVLGHTSCGVKGDSGAGEGVRGNSSSNNGVVGFSAAAGKSGVNGSNSNAAGYGVYGRNTATNAFGYLGGSNATGVYGSVAGSSAWGALGGAGDHAGMSDPPGVYAFGLLGQATAMVVDGQAKFLTSGRMTIPAGKSAATVSKVAWGSGTVPLKLLPNCLVLATLQTNRAGLYVQAAVPNISKGTVTVYLNKKVTAATKVAWFVLNFGAP
jgi:hypothetical protein